MNISRLSISTLVLCIVTACGGAGGDNGLPVSNSAAVAAAARFAELWKFPGEWNGTANDEAYLLIKSPDAEGVAEAILYDFDDAEQNCYFVEDGGKLAQSLQEDKMFLAVSVFTSAIVDITPSDEMKVTVFAENATTDTAPLREFIATREEGIDPNDFNVCV